MVGLQPPFFTDGSTINEHVPNSIFPYFPSVHVRFPPATNDFKSWWSHPQSPPSLHCIASRCFWGLFLTIFHQKRKSPWPFWLFGSRSTQSMQVGTPPSVWGWSCSSSRRWWDLDGEPLVTKDMAIGNPQKMETWFLIDDMSYRWYVLICHFMFLLLHVFCILLLCFYPTCFKQQS